MSCFSHVPNFETGKVMWRIIADPDNVDQIRFDEGSQKVFKQGDAGFSFSVYLERNKKYVYKANENRC
jgi:hypothetical protein